MKSLIIAALVIIAAIDVSAQPANTCEGRVVPLFRIINGKLKMVCEPVPSQDPNTNGEKTLKWRTTPIVYRFDVASFANLPCVNMNDVEQCVDDAFKRWLSICPSLQLNARKATDLTGLEPAILIAASTNPADFVVDGVDHSSDADGIALPVYNTTSATYKNQSGNTPPIPSKILINNSNTFKQKSSVFFTTTCPAPSSCSTPNKFGQDLCSVMMHEVGHMLGMIHPDDPKLNPACTFSFDHESPLMRQVPEQRQPCNKLALTMNDRCEFCNLYCPENCATLKVKKGAQIGHILVWPNPAKTLLRVSLTNLSEPCRLIRISDILGVQVLHIDAPSEQELVLDVSNFAPGSYVVTFETDSTFFSKLFVKE